VITRAVPEFDGVVNISFEKLSEFSQNYSWLELVWIRCMNGVHNNENFLDVGKMNSLIDTTSDCKEFSFSSYNIDNMM